MNAFYEKVDKLCERKGINHRKLAEIIGVNEVTLSRYLRLQRKIPLMPFMSMCKTFDLTAEDLYKTYLFASMQNRVLLYQEVEERRGRFE